MKRLYLLFAILTVVGCGGPTPPPSPNLGFLPGECLTSDKLSFQKESSTEIRCLFDFDGYEKVWGKNQRSAYTYLPSGLAWDGIANKEQVQRKYEELISSHMTVFSHVKVAVFSSGEASVVANKEFMGREAGENLFDIVSMAETDSGEVWEILEQEGLVTYFDDPVCAYGYSWATRVTLPKAGIDEMENEEIISFEVRLPVKVLLILHGMDERVSNPETQCPMEEHVISGVFSYQKGVGFRVDGKQL